MYGEGKGPRGREGNSKTPKSSGGVELMGRFKNREERRLGKRWPYGDEEMGRRLFFWRKGTSAALPARILDCCGFSCEAAGPIQRNAERQTRPNKNKVMWGFARERSSKGVSFFFPFYYLENICIGLG